MKRYLKIIDAAAMIMIFIGIAISLFWGSQMAMWECGIGLLLFVVSFIIKAFHWQEYSKENKQNIVILLATIVLLFLSMIRYI